MTARTFGRKGMSDGGAVSSRRAAFLGEERARAERAAETDVFPAPVRPVFADAGQAAEIDETPRRAPVFGALHARSLTRAYVLWLLFGMIGGHRFYLGRPITGGMQAILFVAALALVVGEYYVASAGLMLSTLWMVADGFQIKRMHQQVNERIAAFA